MDDVVRLKSAGGVACPRRRSGRRRLLGAGVLVLALGSAWPAGAAAAPKASPDALWRAYPLKQQPSSTRPQPRPRAPAAPTARVGRSSERGGSSKTILIVALVAIAALADTLLVAQKRWRVATRGRGDRV
jgi:hypothetical protein